MILRVGQSRISGWHRSVRLAPRYAPRCPHEFESDPDFLLLGSLIFSTNSVEISACGNSEQPRTPGLESPPCAPSVAATEIGSSGAIDAGCRRGTTGSAPGPASTYCPVLPPRRRGLWEYRNPGPSLCRLYWR